jgi:starch phosphorylase
MPLSPTRDFPTGLEALSELALDLRWTWSHEADVLWERVDAEAWSHTGNPWIILQDISAERLRALAADRSFVDELKRLVRTRQAYLDTPGWFSSAHGAAALSGVAYFSMEFGLGEGLPLYAGGLGVLAGDFLKTASDLGLPVIGVGLLYQEGYFRQIIDALGVQHEAYPFNDPGSMPIQPAQGPDGAWLRIPLDLPGRTVSLRVWQALLDANDPVNSPADRGITGKLYEAGTEIRILQEIVLGVAGWRVVEALAPTVEICHLNEGHAAFAVLERARAYMRRSGLSFWEALWATRAGNLFTTHTPVEAGFDRFPAELLGKHARYLEGFLGETGIGLDELLALGRVSPDNRSEPYNMACLAMRGSMMSFGVSRLHGRVSHTSAAVSALAGGGGAGRSRHQRRPCPELGFAARRPSVDRRLRQGALAGGAGCASRSDREPFGRRAVDYGRRGTADPDPTGARSAGPPARQPRLSARDGRTIHERARSQCARRTHGNLRWSWPRSLLSMLVVASIPRSRNRWPTNSWPMTP